MACEAAAPETSAGMDKLATKACGQGVGEQGEVRGRWGEGRKQGGRGWDHLGGTGMCQSLSPFSSCLAPF